jgi:hypothetical protein
MRNDTSTTSTRRTRPMGSTRMEIAEEARYTEDAWGDPQYYVLWKGRMFTSGDTGNLVDQVQLHEKTKETD